MAESELKTCSNIHCLQLHGKQIASLLFRSTDWGDKGFCRIEMSTQSICGLYATASQPTGAVYASSPTYTPSQAALLRNTKFQITVPRLGASACIFRCDSCKMPSDYSVPGAMPTIMSHDCFNITDARKSWKAIKVMEQLWQISSGDGLLCLTTAADDVIAAGGE